MQIDRKAVQDAYELLDSYPGNYSAKGNQILKALHTALEAPEVEQEPVAWVNYENNIERSVSRHCEEKTKHPSRNITSVPLYFRPTPKHLSDEEILEIGKKAYVWMFMPQGREKFLFEFARAILEAVK